MNKKSFIHRAFGFTGVLLLVSVIGCSEEAKDSVNDAVQNAEDAAGDVVDDASEMVEAAGDDIADAGEKAKDAAAKLGENSLAYLTSVKERFGNLDSLKEKPEELKKWVDETLKSIEEKAEGVELPQAVSDALASVKEKLVALKDYLAGEIEQAKIDEHIKGIIESAKSGLGLS